VAYPSDDTRLRQANRYALAHGYAAGLLNFEEGLDGHGLVINGVNLFKPGPYIEFRDIFRDDLRGVPALADAQATWRAIHEYAQASGYFTGFPTFEQGDHGQGVVYGAMLLKAGPYLTFQDVFKHDLYEHPEFSNAGACIRNINRWALAIANGYQTGFPDFEQANNGLGVVYGAMLLKDFIEFRDVHLWELQATTPPPPVPIDEGTELHPVDG